MTQADLAAKVGISTSFMGHIERGTCVASLETLEGLGNALHSSLNYLALNRSSMLSGDSAHMTEKMRTLNDLFRIIQEHADPYSVRGILSEDTIRAASAAMIPVGNQGGLQGLHIVALAKKLLVG